MGVVVLEEVTLEDVVLLLVVLDDVTLDDVVLHDVELEEVLSVDVLELVLELLTLDVSVLEVLSVDVLLLLVVPVVLLLLLVVVVKVTVVVVVAAGGGGTGVVTVNVGLLLTTPAVLSDIQFAGFAMCACRTAASPVVGPLYCQLSASGVNSSALTYVVNPGGIAVSLGVLGTATNPGSSLWMMVMKLLNPQSSKRVAWSPRDESDIPGEAVQDTPGHSRTYPASRPPAGTV